MILLEKMHFFRRFGRQIKYSWVSLLLGAFLASNNMHQLRVLQVIFVSGSSKVISMSANKLIMWDSPITSDISKAGGLDVVDFKRTRRSDFICVKLSNSNGDYLAAASNDNIITIWKLASAEVVMSLPGHNK